MTVSLPPLKLTFLGQIVFARLIRLLHSGVINLRSTVAHVKNEDAAAAQTVLLTQPPETMKGIQNSNAL